MRAMEKYDFDTVVPRGGTDSYKWDTPEQEGVLPMWVADMDFRAAPCIVEALRRRVSHGVFGYTRVPAAYYDAVTDWFARRHGWRIDPHWILYTTGVVPALSAVIKALTVPGDRVIVQTPAYNCFYSSIRNNGCELLANRLRYEGGAYTIDFDDLETKASDPKAKLLLLCNPHNPVGRVWTREELRRLGEICLRHGVRVVADEIHCELTYEGHDYTPFASLSDDFLHGSVTCNSPSKAFNLAGMQIANIVSADADVRTGIDRAINDNEVCDVNPFGVEALMAAYDRGEEWLDRLREYLADNYRMLCRVFAAISGTAPRGHVSRVDRLPDDGSELRADRGQAARRSEADDQSRDDLRPRRRGFYPAQHRMSQIAARRRIAAAEKSARQIEDNPAS